MGPKEPPFNKMPAPPGVSQISRMTVAHNGKDIKYPAAFSLWGGALFIC